MFQTAWRGSLLASIARSLISHPGVTRIIPLPLPLPFTPFPRGSPRLRDARAGEGERESGRGLRFSSDLTFRAFAIFQPLLSLSLSASPALPPPPSRPPPTPLSSSSSSSSPSCSSSASTLSRRVSGLPRSHERPCVSGRGRFPYFSSLISPSLFVFSHELLFLSINIPRYKCGEKTRKS